MASDKSLFINLIESGRLDNIPLENPDIPFLTVSFKPVKSFCLPEIVECDEKRIHKQGHEELKKVQN